MAVDLFGWRLCGRGASFFKEFLMDPLGTDFVVLVCVWYYILEYGFGYNTF